MSPLSRDPSARAKQLANLRPGAAPAPSENRRRVSHGAYARLARERVEAKVCEVFDALGDDLPLKDPDGGMPAADGPTVRLAAECLCRLDDLAAYLRDHGLLDEGGNVRPAVEIEARLRREAADHLDALGLSPRSRARLGVDLARSRDLAREMAAEARRERGLSGPAGEGGNA